jgi:glycerophosphoryl diester phosphodiesterase
VSYDGLFKREQSLLTVDNKKHNDNTPIPMGHRGGFRPDNSMEGFKKALDNHLPIVEFDVSLPPFP